MESNGVLRVILVEIIEKSTKKINGKTMMKVIECPEARRGCILMIDPLFMYISDMFTLFTPRPLSSSFLLLSQRFGRFTLSAFLK